MYFIVPTKQRFVAVTVLYEAVDMEIGQNKSDLKKCLLAKNERRLFPSPLIGAIKTAPNSFSSL